MPAPLTARGNLGYPDKRTTSEFLPFKVGCMGFRRDTLSSKVSGVPIQLVVSL